MVKTIVYDNQDEKLLQEIKERVIRIEDNQKAIADSLVKAENILNTRLGNVEGNFKEHQKEDEQFQKQITLILARYDSYFKLRNEIKNITIFVLFGMVTGLLAWRFMPK